MRYKHTKTRKKKKHALNIKEKWTK